MARCGVPVSIWFLYLQTQPYGIMVRPMVAKLFIEVRIFTQNLRLFDNGQSLGGGREKIQSS